MLLFIVYGRDFSIYKKEPKNLTEEKEKPQRLRFPLSLKANIAHT